MAEDFIGVEPYSLLSVSEGIDANPNPPMIDPRIEETTPTKGVMIDVEVKDRLLLQMRRRLFPSDVEGILYTALTGDLFYLDQLFQIMIDTWPRLQTNLNKLKRAVSRLSYSVNAYRENEKDPTPSAIEKANLVKRALFGMTPNIPFQQRDFKETLEDIVESIPTGFVVSEIYWESRKGEVSPRCTRRIPARYYRYPYVVDATDRLMLNPSGDLGGTDLYDFPPYKFLICIKPTSVAHPVQSAMMRCMAAWWVASRFGLEWFMNYAQLFGIPFRKATYTTGDQQVYQQLIQMMRQAGSASWGVFPEGTNVEILNPASGGAAMPQERLMEAADKACDILLLGQTLTTEVGTSGSRALGGIHKEVLDEIIESAALWTSKIVNTQIIPGIVRFNFGAKEPLELPVLDPIIKNPLDLLQTAQAFQILFGKGVGQMGIPVKKEEIYDRIEFSVPEDDSDLLEPNEPPVPAPAPAGFGLGPSKDQGAGFEPRDRSGERIGVPGGGTGATPKTRNMINPGSRAPRDQGPKNKIQGVSGATFTLDYGLEPEPGEILRFIEGAMPEEEIEMIKKNVDMHDDKVCPKCREISREGWINVDDLFRGFAANAPHHPNCRCSTEYAIQRVREPHDHYPYTKSGNPRHHPSTGKFV